MVLLGKWSTTKHKLHDDIDDWLGERALAKHTTNPHPTTMTFKFPTTSSTFYVFARSWSPSFYKIETSQTNSKIYKRMHKWGHRTKTKKQNSIML